MKVVNEKILIKVIKESDNSRTPSGLTIPNTSIYEGIEKAKVVGVSKNQDEIKVGDVCFIYLGCGKEFTNPEDGEKYRVISPSEIVVVL